MSDTLETVAAFHDLTEAQGARAALEAEGIPAELRDENTGSIDWGLMPAMGGLRLQVRPADAPRALEILEQLSAIAEADPSHRPTDADDEAEYREGSRQRKRAVGFVALLILLTPLLIGFVSFLILWLEG